MATLSRWADEIDDDDFGLENEQPVSQKEIGGKPDFLRPREGERIVTEVKADPDTGKKYQIHRTFRLEKKLVSKGVIDRKTRWAKFGESKNDGPGPNSATTVVADEVLMQFLNASKHDDGADDVNNPFTKMQQEGKGFVKCRYCHDSHFSAKCPYKDVAGFQEVSSAVTGRGVGDGDEKMKTDSESKPGVFLPPALRGGNRRGEVMNSMGSNRKDEATIRVSNLPESMSETDMQELCNPFGKIDRIFLAKDRATGVCKGFAFVTYANRETAARALRALNGYGYDHLILNVEWSKPANN